MAWLISSVAIAEPAHADTLALTSFSGGVGTTAGARYGGQANLTIGWRFTVGAQAIAVSGLGFFDQNGDGLDIAHAVGMWDDSGGLLASVMVQSGTASTLVDGFRFESLGSALVLGANQSYVIGSQIIFPSSDVFFTQTTATFDPQIVFSAVRDVPQPFNPGFVFPSRTRSDLTSGLFGPNFEIAPEPATLFLLGGGLVGLAGLRRRQ